MSKSSPADGPKKVQLEIPCSSEFATIARKAMEGICARLPISKSEIGDITLAVGEACTNAIKFSGPDKAPVQFTCTVDGDSIEVTVRNRGESFAIDRSDTALPPLEHLDRGGMGLYVISRIMDDLKVSSKDGVTTLRMVKKLGEGSRK